MGTLLTFFTGGIGRWLALAALLLVAGLYAGMSHYRSEYQLVTAQYAAFVAETKAIGEQAKAANLLKEREWNAQVQGAITDRDAARSELRKYSAAHPPSRASSNNPTAPEGNGNVCFDAPAYNAAFKQFGASLDRFIQDAQGFAVEGDEAAIDSRALLAAWPK